MKFPETFDNVTLGVSDHDRPQSPNLVLSWEGKVSKGKSTINKSDGTRLENLAF